MTHANGVAGADYAGGGIFNLMQSIAQACGAPASDFAQCATLPAERLAATRHLVLFVIDGLGLPALAALPESSSLRRHRIGSLSSVFPSTTASAITTALSPESNKSIQMIWSSEVQKAEDAKSIGQVAPFRFVREPGRAGVT